MIVRRTWQQARDRAPHRRQALLPIKRRLSRPHGKAFGPAISRQLAKLQRARGFIRAGLQSSLFLSLACIACGASSSHSAAGNDAGPNLNVSPVSCPDAGAIAHADAGSCVVHEAREFSRDIVPLFDSCAGELCHSFAGGQISQQIGAPAVECCSEIQMIEPGHPERSYVLRKLLGQDLCGGSAMPLDKPRFSADDTQAIADWICQGADTTR